VDKSQITQKGISMNMKDHLAECERKARQIKSDYPDAGLTKRRDIAAQLQGFGHYTSLKKLYELLGPDKSPSRLEIVMAGGNERECPYRSIDASFVSGWSAAEPVSSR
jgi:hypothetical protein